jgi:hypothetical protein
VQAVEEWTATAGCQELLLSTGSIMAPAIGLYTKCGFERCVFPAVELANAHNAQCAVRRCFNCASASASVMR